MRIHLYLIIMIVFIITSCGQKGPLYLPTKNEVRFAQLTASAFSPISNTEAVKFAETGAKNGNHLY